MGFAIPKIEYKNDTTSGTTANGSGTLTAVESTEDVEAGMFITGTGIPDNSTVESVTDDEIVLANGAVCTASAAGVTLTFGHRIEFDYPPKEAKGEALDTKASITESLSGLRQVSVNYTEVNRSVTFSFLSPALYILMRAFLENHAILGEEFRYFEDKTLTTYVDYELDTLKVDPKKIAPRGVDTYIWEVPLKFRRVV